MDGGLLTNFGFDVNAFIPAAPNAALATFLAVFLIDGLSNANPVPAAIAPTGPALAATFYPVLTTGATFADDPPNALVITLAGFIAPL